MMAAGNSVTVLVKEASMTEGVAATPSVILASFTKKVNTRVAKRPLKTNGRLANRGWTSSVKEARAVWMTGPIPYARV